MDDEGSVPPIDPIDQSMTGDADGSGVDPIGMITDVVGEVFDRAGRVGSDLQMAAQDLEMAADYQRLKEAWEPSWFDRLIFDDPDRLVEMNAELERAHRNDAEYHLKNAVREAIGEPQLPYKGSLTHPDE